MTDARSTFLASAIVLFSGATWGIYWLPIRVIADGGLAGAWGTLIIVAAATVALIPSAIRNWTSIRKSSPIALISIALGGFAFVLYSVGLLYGRVAIIVILFYLTPLWSTLIGRLFLGWSVSPFRLWALVIGLVGLIVMLGAGGEMPIPQGFGEWLGLISGFLWSVATTGIRVKATTGAGATAFIFVLGATFGCAILAPVLDPFPSSVAPSALILAILTGAVWWSLSITGLMWASARLEPARVGILLMTEVLLASISAAILADETLGLIEIVGGILVLVAGLLEVFPNQTRQQPHIKMPPVRDPKDSLRDSHR